MKRVAVLLVLATAGACSSDSGPSRAHRGPTSTRAAPTTIAVRGTARLDGAPFDTRWIGAYVRADDLMTSCQAELPPIDAGRFSVRVYRSTASAGCGKAGAQLVMWTFAKEHIIYAARPIAWPRSDSADVTVDFASRNPLGAGTKLREYNGGVRTTEGGLLPVGTKVEAFIGSTLCGVASVRATRDYDGYILALVGPTVQAGCVDSGRITFKVNGRVATPSRDPAVDSHDAVDLRVATSS